MADLKLSGANKELNEFLDFYCKNSKKTNCTEKLNILYEAIKGYEHEIPNLEWTQNVCVSSNFAYKLNSSTREIQALEKVKNIEGCQKIIEYYKNNILITEAIIGVDLSNKSLEGLIKNQALQIPAPESIKKYFNTLIEMKKKAVTHESNQSGKNIMLTTKGELIPIDYNEWGTELTEDNRVVIQFYDLIIGLCKIKGLKTTQDYLMEIKNAYNILKKISPVIALNSIKNQYFIPFNLKKEEILKIIDSKTY